MRLLSREAALLVVVVLSAAEGREICLHNSYTMRNGFCYRYVASSATYTQATQICERDKWNSSMLYITSAEEDEYIWSEMFIENDKTEFWLGLDDKVNEGDFRWSYNNSQPVYKNFSSDLHEVNNDNADCVKFSETGWQVHNNFCENSVLPFVCKAPVCDSSDGINCDEGPVESDNGGLSAGAIAAIVIVIIIVVCVIVVLVVLCLMWRFKSDFFHHYLCPCAGQASKQAMMSLQQENQRLRQELNQLKMNSSTRFSTGHLGRESVSGVPDGMGGMLPPIKQGSGGGGGGGGMFTSPPDLTSPTSATRPPPLSLQRGISRVAPATTPGSGGPFFSSPPPSVFTAQSLRSPRQSVLSVKPSSGGGGAVGGASLPTLKERENEDISSSSEEEGSQPSSSSDKAEEKPPSTEVRGQEEKPPAAGSTEVKGQEPTAGSTDPEIEGQEESADAPNGSAEVTELKLD